MRSLVLRLRRERPWGSARALVAALACLIGAPLLISLAMDEREASRDGGVVGRYTVTESSCGGRSCSFVADFRSDDGALALEDVAVSDEVRPDVGDVGDARYLESTGSLYAVDSDEWRVTMLLGVAMVLFVLGYLVWLLALRDERRSATGSDDGRPE